MTKDSDNDKNVKKGPWGSKKSDERKNTSQSEHNPNPENHNHDEIPDIEEFLRHAQSSFGDIFGNSHRGKRNSQNNGEFRNLLGILIAITLGLWLATGLYRVLPEEDAVILTFGKWTNTKGDPGLGYALPWPIQEVHKVNVAFDRKLEVGFRDNLTASGRMFSRNSDSNLKVPSESIMLTGDENIVDINFVVMWNILDAKNYLFEIRDPETTVKKVAESAMREVIGQSKIQSVLTEGRADIEARSKDLMQQMLNDYHSGIVVNNVQLLRVDPPAPVVDAFDDVQRARADKERAKNEGDAYRNDVIPKARGEAQKILQGAEAYKQSVVNKAKGDANRFISVYNAYKVSQDITKKRLYLETMEEIMANSKKFIIGSDKDTPLLPYLPLDQVAPNRKK